MPKKILLADDSITIQKVVELTFSDGDYEVTAVNNGAKAVQKLAEMRPDIILSDIIMPEKNGYEVCEYVKSHPEFRNIPVVLLTGTFEPFDPDRAEKAGCDAVVTKPFESQSLIHKVEELIAQSRTSAQPAAAPEAAPTSPWVEETPAPAPPPQSASPFTTSTGSFPAPVMPPSFSHGADIFAAATPAPAGSAPEPATPFDSPADSPFGAPPPTEEFSGATRAFPRMSFDDLGSANAPEAPAAPPPPAAAAPEPSPWDETPEYSGETKAFQKMSFDDFQQPAAAAPPPAAPAPDMDSPFGAPPPVEEFSGETRAFPRMSFEEMNRMAAQPAPAAPEPPSSDAGSPWDEPAPTAPAFGESPAFGQGAFGDTSPAEPAPAAPAEPSLWAEPEAPAFGETRAFPKMSFEDFQESAAPEPPPAPEPSPWDDSAPTTPPSSAYSPSTTMPVESLWAHEPAQEPEAPVSDYSSDTASSSLFGERSGNAFDESPEPQAAMPEDMPFSSPVAAEPEIAPEEPSWAPMAAAEARAEADEPAMPSAALAPAAAGTGASARGGELSDEQVDRIARRVVELMSADVVRNIAWEVIPDLAETVVKERIRQLEAEA